MLFLVLGYIGMLTKVISFRDNMGQDARKVKWSQLQDIMAHWGYDTLSAHGIKKS